MYSKIMVTLDGSSADRGMIDHIKSLATIMRSKVVLLRVATGVPARVNGDDATGKEVNESREYLERIKVEFVEAGVEAQTVLAFGDPVREIIKGVEASGCDLLAMGTHGHRLLADLLLGATANKVRHGVKVPVLMLRAS